MIIDMCAMDHFDFRLGGYLCLAPSFPWKSGMLQLPTKCSCNDLHFCSATTYIFGLQLPTFLLYNKQILLLDGTEEEYEKEQKYVDDVTDEMIESLFRDRDKKN